MIRTHYPDPESVRYASTYPPRFVPYMTTRGAVHSNLYPIHRHTAFVDRHRNGNTDAVDGHYHYVRDGAVLPDPQDGHTHEMTWLPAGAG